MSSATRQPSFYKLSDKNDSNLNNNEKEDEYSLSDNVYSPEAIYSAWLNLSFFSVTAAMVFYGITSSITDGKNKRLNVHPALVAFIAIGLILVSVSYVYAGIYPYYRRMTIAINKCEKNKKCFEENLNEIKNLRLQLTLVGIATIFLESLIALLIIWNTYKLL
jgi:hypothetical protein